MIAFFLIGVLIMTLSGSVGAIFFKKAMSALEGRSFLLLFKTPTFYIGGFCYAVGLLTNVVLMQYFDYTLVYPSSALTYAWTLFISFMFLKERINWQKIAAVVCIVFGVIIMNI